MLSELVEPTTNHGNKDIMRKYIELKSLETNKYSFKINR